MDNLPDQWQYTAAEGAVPPTNVAADLGFAGELWLGNLDVALHKPWLFARRAHLLDLRLESRMKRE